MFKVLVGKQAKGGSTEQQERSVELAALDLEQQLNDKSNNIESVQSVFVHDSNPLAAEVIAIATATDKPTRKEK